MAMKIEASLCIVLFFFLLSVHSVENDTTETDTQEEFRYLDDEYDNSTQIFLDKLPSAENATEYNSGRRLMGYGKVLNEIDSCWRNDPNWSKRRQQLADCGVGFGALAMGGKYGRVYTVTNPGDDCENPAYGTLRWGVIQTQPLWIVFARDMVIRLKAELMITNYKTIDGRGVNVHIAFGPCITIQHVHHVIIHGISIHDCKPDGAHVVRDSTYHMGHRRGADGDGIVVFDSNNVWIDHCTLFSCADGLIDVIHASSMVTISNCHFHDHDKVILMGHDDGFSADKVIKATVVYNRFGPNLEQRLPRGRFGYFHVANNDYMAWDIYAIGGSANPTFRSEGNRFLAPNNPDRKEVTKREVKGGLNWNWRSFNDMFLNGAFFKQGGYGTCAPYYSVRQRFTVMSPKLVPLLTADAGRLNCKVGQSCKW